MIHTDDRLPLYKEAKMVYVLWLVLPQTQGATYLYLHYLHPNIARHERDIDRLIIRLHEQAKSRGGQYVQLGLSWIQELLFGPAMTMAANEYNKPTKDPRNEVPESSYVSALFSRFRTVPVGAYPETIPSTLLSFLSMSGKSGEIIPSNLSPEERAKYVNIQKSKLNEWLLMLDAAAASYPPVNLDKKSTPSDSDYEDLGADEVQSRPPVKKTWFWRSVSSG